MQNLEIVRNIKSQLFNLVCHQCGKDFLSTYPTKKDCSNRCRHKREYLKHRSHGGDSRKRRRMSMLSKLIAKFGAICWYCGVELDEVIHIDHIIPKCQGGANTLENRALTCKMCNLAKNRYPLSEFKNWLQYIKNSKFQPLI